MKITLIYKLNFITLSVVCFAGLFAQDKQHKLSEKFVVNNDVIINLNTSHTQVVFETWNKNSVEIEAYIEGENITEENKERLLHNWRIEAIGNSREITLNSITGNFWRGNISATSNRNLPESQMLGLMITDMLGPILKNIENNPMPSALSENLASMNFDTNKYKENEEKYIQQWGDQIKEKFGDNYENVVKNWTNELSKNANKIQSQVAITPQNWEGEEFAKRMQAWASQFSGDIEITQRNGANVMVYSYSSNSSVNSGKIDRIVKVKMPKAALLKLNIRHGDIKLAEKTTNMIASLSHTSLDANIIEGDRTFVRVSYSPVSIKQWNSGRLAVNYVKNCRIQNAKNLRVNADSSNIFIQELEENGAISGSFGAITIANLSESFDTLDLAVENSDFKLNLPKNAFNISYSGVQSRISLPKTIEAKARKNFGNVFVNGFHKTRNTDKVITINAKYSDIILQ
ncbi:hypothetical protein [Aquimarina sp. 2201CG14-23]|uniref:hypothetical protein n=1 Tax=Aquimarina mycalae TaxID=3040073 RepID=UPI002477FECD|nr:hypothetical protein [Aquimarina sp. 2201CG14-23]MDH7444443.1 hypothetical protein [Aquimarina sp. 2201CG14-23]